MNREPLVALLLNAVLQVVLLLALLLLAGMSNAASPNLPNDFDPAEAATLLDVGEATLTGRPGASRIPLASAGKPRLGRPKRERVYTKNEVVYLFPYTAYVQRIVERHRSNPALLMLNLNVVGEYTARTLTDADGRFAFRGLKPGRYVLMTAVPYEAAVTIREDTGRTRTETTFGYGFGYVSGASSVTSPIYRYRNATSELEHRILQLVEVGAGATDLGEIE
jgi:hypothetical protein